MTYKDLEVVVLNHDISEYGLKAGNTGTIVDVYKNGETYEVEFMTEEGKTIAILTLDSKDISPNVEISLKSQKAKESDKIFKISPVGNFEFTPSYHSDAYNAYINI